MEVGTSCDVGARCASLCAPLTALPFKQRSVRRLRGGALEVTGRLNVSAAADKNATGCLHDTP